MQSELSLSLGVDEKLGIYYFILVFDSCACGAGVLLWTESLCSPSPSVNAPTPSATWGLQRELALKELTHRRAGPL